MAVGATHRIYEHTSKEHGVARITRRVVATGIIDFYARVDGQRQVSSGVIDALTDVDALIVSIGEKNARVVDVDPSLIRQSDCISRKGSSQ